jgi:Ribbon-helix-helix protein, copG family
MNEPTEGPEPLTAITIRVPASLRDALNARAREEDRSTASLLRIAALRYLNGHPTPAGQHRD